MGGFQKGKQMCQVLLPTVQGPYQVSHSPSSAEMILIYSLWLTCEELWVQGQTWHPASQRTSHKNSWKVTLWIVSLPSTPPYFRKGITPDCLSFSPSPLWFQGVEMEKYRGTQSIFPFLSLNHLAKYSCLLLSVPILVQMRSVPWVCPLLFVGTRVNGDIRAHCGWWPGDWQL